MSEQNIRSAIESRLAAWADARTPALRIAWQNVPFQPANGETYLMAFLLPARTTSADLAGEHRAHVGIYQVSIVCPISSGTGQASGIADELEALFPLYQRMVSNGQTIQVISPITVASSLRNEELSVTPVSFGYRTDTI